MKQIPLLFCLLLCFALGYHFWWLGDDAFISFQYAKNLAEGHGLRFNVGENPPIEGFTNPLWVLLAAACEYIGLSPAAILPFLSLLCAMLLVWRVYDISTKDFRLSPLLAGFSLLPLIVSPPFVIWSTSGLETMPFALFIFLLAESLFRKSDRPAQLSWLWTILLCLIRADGAAWAIAMLGLAIILRKEKKSIFLRVLVPVIFCSASYLLFRLWYFNEWLPNTAQAKVHSGALVWDRGIRYIATYWLSFAAPVIFSGLSLLSPFFREWRLLCGFSALAFGFYAFSILVGGDFMSLGRFLLPTLPLQSVVLAALVAGLTSIVPRKSILRFALPLCITCLCLPPWFGKYLSSQDLRSQFHFRWNKDGYIDEMKHWDFMINNTMRWEMQAKAIAHFTKPGESLIVGPIGNMGYYTDLFLYDCFGLTTKLDRKIFKSARLRSPGHDLRVTPTYFLSRNPTYFAAKISHETRMQATYKRKASYPRYYAPIAHRIPVDIAGNNELFLVLFKRFPTRKEASEQWKNYKNEFQVEERKS